MYHFRDLILIRYLSKKLSIRLMPPMWAFYNFRARYVDCLLLFFVVPVDWFSRFGSNVRRCKNDLLVVFLTNHRNIYLFISRYLFVVIFSLNGLFIIIFILALAAQLCYQLVPNLVGHLCKDACHASVDLKVCKSIYATYQEELELPFMRSIRKVLFHMVAHFSSTHLFI